MRLVRVFVLAAMMAAASVTTFAAINTDAGQQTIAGPIWCCWPPE